jgi:hypothetical protein
VSRCCETKRIIIKVEKARQTDSEHVPCANDHPVSRESKFGSVVLFGNLLLTSKQDQVILSYTSYSEAHRVASRCTQILEDSHAGV